MSINFADNISFDAKEHVYRNIKTGEEYISVSTLINAFEPPFDPNGEIIAKSAEKRGLSIAEMRKEWDLERDVANEYGTAFHASIEHFIKTKEILNDKYKSFISQFKDVNLQGKFQSEVIMADHELSLAGTCDLIQWISEESFNLIDFKTNKKIEKYSPFKKVYQSPLNNIFYCNFTSYTFQLNLYCYILEKYGFWCEKMFIYYVNRNNQKLEIMDVPFVPDTINKLIGHYKKNKKWFLYQKALKKESIEL